jgi:hypothetical protein
MGVASILACTGFAISWLDDQAILASIVHRVIGEQPIDATTIARLNEFVYRDKGFAKNPDYFLLSRLGPTPVQVLREGGNCADKSRLLSAMLASVGIRSGLVMLYPCRGCASDHTVVEIQLQHANVVADPIWNVTYNRSLGALARSDFAERRIAFLRAALRIAGTGRKIFSMPPDNADFRFAKSINFNADPEMRLAGVVLWVLGVDRNNVMRPAILEDPKLLCACFTGLLALLFIALSAATASKPFNGILNKAGLRSPLPDQGTSSAASRRNAGSPPP